MPLRILYLEDSKSDASLVLSRLLHSGLDVELKVVHTREGFADALATGNAQIVLCDNAVPGYSGVAAIEEAKWLCPAAHVLMLSSRIEASEAARCLDNGATDVLSKTELWRLPYAIRRLTTDRPPSAPPSAGPWGKLVDVVQALSLARDLETIMQIVRKAARELTGADGATFVLRDGDKCHYADEDAIEPLWKGMKFPMSMCISGWVMINRLPALIPDIYADERIPADAYRPTFVKSLAMVPIRTSDPLGAIGNYWATPHTPTTDELALLAALADTTSVAIENVQLYSGLEQRVRDRTAELEAANRELEAFSYSVSHDLRSPISAVKGYVEMLAEDYSETMDDSGRDVLKQIENAGIRMLGVIDSLLSLAKLTRSPLAWTTVNLSQLVKDGFIDLQSVYRNRKVTLTVEPELIVNADVDLLRIVLENLLSNAIKYSGRREVAVIDFGQLPEAPGTYFIRDNGAGFDMSKVSWLFAPFHRLHDDSDFPGTGVGLATVQRIINRHGGRIWVESAVDQGTTFFFTLAPDIEFN